MGDIVISVLKWVFRAGFIIAGITAFVILLNMAFGLVFVSLNGNVLSDLFAMIQIWLPFNLNALLGWLIAASIAYITYRLAVVAINYISRLTAS